MRVAIAAITATLFACNGNDHQDDTSDTGAPQDTGTASVPDSYGFTSRDGEASSVSYSGQVMRSVLVHDLKGHIGVLTARLDNALFFPAEGDVESELNFYFEFDSSTAGALGHQVSTTPAPLQTSWNDISSDKNLVGKLAGNDATGQHADWSTDFVGWDADGVTTPESLVRHWFGVIDDQAVDWGAGTYPLDPDGQPVPAVYITPQGQDLQQLTEKFLLGAIHFSQAADDYLDNDIDGKGLLADHSALAEGASHTELEHAWDEGFGYFGASRSYGSWTDEQIANDNAVDADEDGKIDLTSEMCFGASVNAAKRDLGANPAAATDFTADAWNGFLMGRHLLATTDDTLTDAQMAELEGYRDQAIGAWEAAIAATVVHYINDTLQDMGAFGTDGYGFAAHAKHWSEMKGFALSFQFNPHSPVSDTDFATLHGLLGTAPVLENAEAADITAYRDDLIAARALIGTAYGFDAANLGDSDGLGGW